MSIAEIYESRKGNPLWNTSYPLSPNDWAQYKVDTALSFAQVKNLCFYIHIPFCSQLCNFCEYSKIICPKPEFQRKYLEIVLSDIRSFKLQNTNYTIHGFDIGGGTPTVLDDDNYAFLMDIYQECIEGLPLSNDYEPSIEATFQTVSKNKIESLVNKGFRRISFGVQSFDNNVLTSAHRLNDSVNNMQNIMQQAYTAGINKINLDFMYGLKHQTLESVGKDIEIIRRLHPEQVTLYELRPNMIAGQCNATSKQRYDYYKLLFYSLIDMGYYSSFGQNTFSVNSEDLGLSSYIRNRMKNFMPYKGFGISAQSMSNNGLSYNIGKKHFNAKNILYSNSFHEEDTYILPKNELASKYIAISAYSGTFSLSKLSQIIGKNAANTYREQLDYCINSNLLFQEGDLIKITEKGFEHYGAVFSLFSSSRETFRSKSETIF